MTDTKMEAARKQKKLCPHQRQKIYCRDCGGSGFCEHQRIRSRCKDCIVMPSSSAACLRKACSNA